MPISDNKYRLLWIEDLILNNEIYIPSAKKLNDPFELSVHWQIAEQLKSTPAALFLLFQHENLIERTGILSFSRKFNSLLMWSHYGASHSGICFKFKIVDKDIFKRNFKKVKYASIIPSKKDGDFLWRKSIDWKYEQEIRYITERNVNQIKNISDIGLKIENVILGSNTSIEDARKIISFCSGGRESYLQKAQLRSDKYELELSNHSFQEIRESYIRRAAIKSLRDKKLNIR